MASDVVCQLLTCFNQRYINGFSCGLSVASRYFHVILEAQMSYSLVLKSVSTYIKFSGVTGLR